MYVPVYEDDGRMSPVSEAREDEVSEEHQKTAEGGEEAERKVNVLHVIEFVAELLLPAVFVERGVSEDVVFEAYTRDGPRVFAESHL